MTARDPILHLTVAAFLGGAWPLAPLPLACGAVGALLVLLRRRWMSARWAGLLLLVWAAAGARACGAEADARASYDQARALASPPRACALQGEVVTSPVAQAGAVRFVLSVRGGTCGDVPVGAGTRVQLRSDDATLARGDLVRVEGVLAPLSLFDNPGVLPPWVRISRSGVALSATATTLSVEQRASGLSSRVDHARAHVRERIVASYHPEAQGLARALVLGESDLDEAVLDAFRATGLSHVLAVSGTHLVVAVLGLCAALRALLLRTGALAQRLDVGRIAALMAIPLCWAYADFAGQSGSVVRAAAMLSAILLARALGRKACAVRAFALTLGLGVVFDPVALLDISFTLSACAALGLLALATPIAALLGAREDALSRLGRAWSLAASAMGTTIAATVACAPITVALSGELPVLGVLANLIAAPLGELVALPFALGHALLSPWPSLELGAARVASGALLAVAEVARLTSGLGGVLAVPPPTAWQLVVLMVGVLALARTRPAGRALGAGVLGLALFALELGHRWACRRPGELTLTALDVGQGDSIMVDLPDGSLMLIDGGGVPGQSFDVGRRVLLPVLRARRRSGIDYLVISHPHPDHYGGLHSVVARAPYVREVWDSGGSAIHPNRDMDRLLASAREKGARVLGPDELCGAPREIGGATIEVLWPCPALEPDLSANDGSLVLRVRYGDRSALLMGDAEEEAERRLLTSGAALSADVLKVGHHGSRTSTTPELLEAVSPSVALISCGVRNRFGHPHPETMAALALAGVEVARTDAQGAVSLTTSGAVWARQR